MKCHAGMTAKHPNIVLIMTDNQPADAVGCYGNAELHTPNLDALAAAGLRFDNAYCPNAMCSPSRASLWTGRMPCQHGVATWLDDRLMHTWPKDWSAVDEFPTLPEILKEAGYATALIGKYHLGRPDRPQNGIDHWIAMARGHTLSFYGNEMLFGGGSGSESHSIVFDGHSVDFFTDRAVDYIESRSNEADRPFLLMLPYNGPYGHWPSIKGPAENEFWELYKDAPMTSVPREGLCKQAIEIYKLTTTHLLKGQKGPDFSSLLQLPNDLTSLRNYYSQVTLIDDRVGRVMNALRENGFGEDTLVIFTADHGFSLGHHGFWGHGQGTWPSNGFRIGYNIPLIAWGAGIAGGRISDRYVSGVDVFATLLDRLGLWEDRYRAGVPSRSFAPVLAGETIDRTDEVFLEQEETRAIRTPEWSYFKRFDGSKAYPLENELYDLSRDPDERNNVAGQAGYGSVERELSERIEAFFDEFADPKHDLWNGGAPKSNTSRPWLWKDAWGEEWQPII